MKASTVKTGRQDWDNCSHSLFTSSICLWHLCVWLKHQRQSQDNELVVLTFSVMEDETARPQSCHTWVHTIGSWVTWHGPAVYFDVNSSMDDGRQMHASDDCCRCSLTVFICKLPCFITLTNIAHSCVGKMDCSCVIPVMMIAYVYIRMCTKLHVCTCTYLLSNVCVCACRHRWRCSQTTLTHNEMFLHGAEPFALYVTSDACAYLHYTVGIITRDSTNTDISVNNSIFLTSIYYSMSEFRKFV